ncbi:hypothetical protein [Mesorhizobium sp. LNHC229A00]|uniref:hypothetical protein n=1 Tax=Mesorhizobium sp. LNHC229A00 TaxID=1287240 RepID=UPI0003CEFDF9|nr:hypothetical protein [Mesorhizobium sp. LNHC229A00]ESY87250.1 hypothetical protein X741_32385 [Mesorhizobium sp. LNHC229A00]
MSEIFRTTGDAINCLEISAGLPKTRGRLLHRIRQRGEWAERGEVTLTEAAGMLNLSSATVLRQIAAGIIPAEQYCKAHLGLSNDEISNSRI